MTDPIQVYWLADVDRFMASQFPLMLDRGHRRETHSANGVVSSINVAPMWETGFEGKRHIALLSCARFPENIHFEFGWSEQFCSPVGGKNVGPVNFRLRTLPGKPFVIGIEM